MTTKPKIKKKTLGDYFDYFSIDAPKAKSEIKPLETVKDQQKNNSVIVSGLKTEPPQISVKGFIKRLQMSGVEFHISPGYFDVGGRSLSGDERERLQKQAGAILCHLQQAALKHFIFDKFPEFGEQFKYEVNERVGIIAETEQPNESAQYAAVRQTAFFWFHDYFIDGVFEKNGGQLQDF